MAFDIATFDWTTLLISLVIQIIFWVITVVPALWISGRLIAGKENAKFTDALWIVIIGTIVFFFINFAMESFIGSYFPAVTAESSLLSLIAPLIAYLVLLIIWLALVKHFFDCGWVKAFAISIVAVVFAVIIWIIIGIILALIGWGAGWFPNPLSMIG